MDWILCLERDIGTGGLLNVWIFRWKEWYIIGDFERFEVIGGNWNYRRFTWQFLKSF